MPFESVHHYQSS
uniref:Uncharacterized protein n=1 Tax=Arundo donax TaxID=35708 RepID=A0A0A9GLM4_ARUDO